MSDHREQNKALSGIVQSMLITKHLLFVGFSLQVTVRVRVKVRVRCRVRVGVRVTLLFRRLLAAGIQHALDRSLHPAALPVATLAMAVLAWLHLP